MLLYLYHLWEVRVIRRGSWWLKNADFTCVQKKGLGATALICFHPCMSPLGNHFQVLWYSITLTNSRAYSEKSGNVFWILTRILTLVKLVNFVTQLLLWVTFDKLSNGRIFKVYLKHDFKTAIFIYLKIKNKRHLQQWLNSYSFMYYPCKHKNVSFWNAFALKNNMIVKMFLLVSFYTSYKLNFLFLSQRISLTSSLAGCVAPTHYLPNYLTHFQSQADPKYAS